MDLDQKELLMRLTEYSMQARWIISITAGWAQVYSIKYCKKLGFNVLSVDQNPKAQGFRFSDEYLISKIDDTQKIINYINSKKIIPSGIIGFVSDAAVIPVGKLRKYYNIYSQSIDMLKLQIDKEKQLNQLIKNKIKVPKSFFLGSIGDSENFIKRLKFPLITKPIIGSGSKGVNKIHSFNELAKIEDSFSYSKKGKIILQEFIEGDEFSIETFCYDKKIKFLATSKREVNESMSATDIFTFEIEKNLNRKIIDEIKKIYEIFKYPDGPGHFEIIIDKEHKPYVIDIHFRGGGFDIYNFLIKEVSGFDIVYNTIMQCTNEELNLKCNKKRNSVLIKFINGFSGILKKIEGIDEINKIDGVSATTFFKVGEKINNSNSDGDRVVMLKSSSVKIETCKKLINDAIKKLNIEIE